MIVVRRVTLSPSADELLCRLAAREDMAPDVFGSLLLELAIRERHDFGEAFAAAAREVLSNGN